MSQSPGFEMEMTRQEWGCVVTWLFMSLSPNLPIQEDVLVRTSPEVSWAVELADRPRPDTTCSYPRQSCTLPQSCLGACFMSQLPLLIKKDSLPIASLWKYTLWLNREKPRFSIYSSPPGPPSQQLLGWAKAMLLLSEARKSNGVCNAKLCKSDWPVITARTGTRNCMTSARFRFVP